MQTIPDDLKDLLGACYLSKEVSARALFPNRFFRPFDQIHQQIFDVLDDRSIQLAVIAAPRGLGKTSIVNLDLPATEALFGEAKYIVPVSATYALAEQQSENLKRELTSNLYVKSIFGDIKTNQFSKEQWVISAPEGEVCVMPRGSGNQIRGMLFKNSRPDLIIVDDLETAEAVATEEQRAKLREWFYGDLMNCVDRGSKKWRIIVIGTVLHEQSLLSELLENPDWKSVRLEICDDELNSLAPNFITTEEIKRIYEQYQRAGKVDTFYREYRNQAHAGGENAAFQQRFFQYYREEDFDLNDDPNVDNIAFFDPARTVQPNSAETAIVCVAVNTKSDAVYVRDAMGAKLHPHEMYSELCLAIQRFNIKVIGVEVTGLHEFILHPLKNELARRGFGQVEIVELHARAGANEKGKVARIKQLLHYYRSGLIYHNRANCASLEAQLLSFPRSKRWDLMDAFGYLPEMLESGQRYMRGYTGETDDKKTVEEEMREVLEEDEEFDSFNFRRI